MYYGMTPGYMNQTYQSSIKKSTCDYRMTIIGRGKVNAAPDKATIVLGVVTEGKELKAIQQENAVKMSQILRTIEGLGISKEDIGTQTYDISIIYDYVDNKRIFRGYRVMNTIKVDLRDLQKIGEVIDAAVASGANQVENVNFTLSDPSIYYRRALNLAVRDAVLNAKSIERTLRIAVDEIPVNIMEEANSYIPLAIKSAVSTYEAATPITPGMLEITATVKAVFRYRRV